MKSKQYLSYVLVLSATLNLLIAFFLYLGIRNEAEETYLLLVVLGFVSAIWGFAMSTVLGDEIYRESKKWGGIGAYFVLSLLLGAVMVLDSLEEVLVLGLSFMYFIVEVLCVISVFVCKGLCPSEIYPEDTVMARHTPIPNNSLPKRFISPDRAYFTYVSEGGKYILHSQVHDRNTTINEITEHFDASDMHNPDHNDKQNYAVLYIRPFQIKMSDGTIQFEPIHKAKEEFEIISSKQWRSKTPRDAQISYLTEKELCDELNLQNLWNSRKLAKIEELSKEKFHLKVTFPTESESS